MQKVVEFFIDIDSGNEFVETQDGKKYEHGYVYCQISDEEWNIKWSKRLKKIVARYIETLPRRIDYLNFATNFLDLCKLRLKDWEGEIIETSDGNKYAVCKEGLKNTYVNIEYVSQCYDFANNKWKTKMDWIKSGLIDKISGGNKKDILEFIESNSDYMSETIRKQIKECLERQEENLLELINKLL